ncbi:MAG TPA: protein kinase, partial [Polyangiales bacterium]
MSSSRPVGWEQLGDYRLLGRFAEGNSCVLRLAVHRGADQSSPLRAVKMPRDEYAHDPMFTQLLVSEAQLLACIQHPNVVAAHGFGREPGGYVALDYVEGDDFRSLQANGRSAPDPRVVAAIVADALQGLDAVHDALGEVGDPLRAVHQAPHARHILVSTDGRARLADFTHARVQRAVSERRRPSRLEAAYRAPEQVLTPDQVDARTDLFILGIAFWEALAGQSLFGASNDAQAAQNVLSAPIRPPNHVSGHSHPSLDRVCMRALERDPQARFASAREMLAALLDAALDLGGIALPAQVGRWVSVQAAAQLQKRRALLGGPAEDGGSAQAVRVQTIPPPAAGLDVRQNLDLNRPFDRNKTLMGQPLSQRPPASAPAPAPESPGQSGTVLAETEPVFRPSRPSSSRPPKEGAGPAAATGNPPSPLPASPSSRPPATGLTYGDRPTDAIRTEGVEIERAVDPAAPANVAPTPADTAQAALPVSETRSVRARITEEYVVTPRKTAVVEPLPASPSSAPPGRAAVPAVVSAPAQIGAPAVVVEAVAGTPVSAQGSAAEPLDAVGGVGRPRSANAADSVPSSNPPRAGNSAPASVSSAPPTGSK